MESTMNTSHQHLKSVVSKAVLIILSTAGLLSFAPATAQAGNVGWTVSVGGGHGGGYGGGWRPAAYGPYGPGWGGGGHAAWRGGYYGPGYGYGYPYRTNYYFPPVVYSAPPVITYATPPQPMVLAAQPQSPVWYYCEASGEYFPYVQSCASGWQTQPAMPPSSNTVPKRTQN
jgi:hypothetical protein